MNFNTVISRPVENALPNLKMSNLLWSQSLILSKIKILTDRLMDGQGF